MVAGAQIRSEGGWGRLLAAVIVGGAAGPAMELVAYPALLHFRDWEMGAIPFMIAQFFYTPVLAGLTAGFLAPHRPYVAAVLAQVVAAAWATAASTLDWWKPQLWGVAGIPLGVPLALWAALVVDPRAAARQPVLGWMQDLSYVLAYLHTVFATLPVPLRWLPSPFGSLIGWAAPAVFFLHVARRNRRARGLAART
ncbi:MAG: hypothetical protein ACK4Z6_00480 [Candidatus Methylomirabilales bacterium]